MVFGASVAVAASVASPALGARLSRRGMLAAMSIIAKEFKSRHDQAYAVGGHQNHGGFVWAPLAPRTIAIKTRLGYPFPSAPLVRTQRMRHSNRVQMRMRNGVGGSVQYEVLISNKAPYSKYHMASYRSRLFGNAHVPARPPVVVTPSDLEFAALTVQSMFGRDDDGGSPGSKKQPRAPKPPSLLRRIGSSLFGGIRSLFKRK